MIGMRLACHAQPAVCAVVTADQAATVQQQLDACATSSKAPFAVQLSASKDAVFLSGPLFLPNNAVLWLDAGVTLHASTNPADFQRTAQSRTQSCNSSGAIPVCGSLDASNTGCLALINGCNISNAGVIGLGTIEGHGWSALTGGPNLGKTWWALANEAKSGGYAQSLNAPKMIDFERSSNITLSGFTIHNAPLVHMRFGRTNGISVSQVTVVTPTSDHSASPFPYNSDGIDFSSSTKVQVDRVDFTTGDDNIALEGGSTGPVNNVSVTNSVFRAPGHGLSIGSPTSGGVTGLTAANLYFLGTDNGLRIKSDAANGGIVDRVTYNNACLRSVKSPIVIDPYYSSSPGSLIPQFKNVTINQLYSDGGALTMRAYAAQPPLTLTLNSVRIDGVKTITASNATITQTYDTKFAYPISIPKSTGVTLTESQESSAAPVDMKAYCLSALNAAQTGTMGFALSAASYDRNAPLAADSIVSFFGPALALDTQSATSAALPVSLAGASVAVTDSAGMTRPAELFAVSPQQINAHIPAGLQPGPAVIAVRTSAAGVVWSPVMIAAAAPSLFSANASGTGAAAAQLITNTAGGAQTTQLTFQCGASAGSCTAIPLDLGAPGDTAALVLYGTGIRGAGKGSITVLMGNQKLTPFYAGPAPNWVGLDQVNAILPRTLAGSGGVNLQVTADGVSSNSVGIAIR